MFSAVLPLSPVTHVHPSLATGQMQLMHSAQYFCLQECRSHLLGLLPFHSPLPIEIDAATLLLLYAERKNVDCVTVLNFLPLFLPGAQLLRLSWSFAAIEVLQFEGISALGFPTACCIHWLWKPLITSGMLAIFCIDTVHGLVNSRRLCVNLGKFGTENVGKSPAVKPIVCFAGFYS